MFTKSFLAVAAALGAVSAAPTCTGTTPPTKTVHLTGVTHTVAAGRGGLRFEPDNIVAAVGDVVEWHFLPKNHSVAQSSFADPCHQQYGGFFSGFFPTNATQSGEVFQVVVEDLTPIWFYCAQTAAGGHCQQGMVGAINQNVDSGKTLDVYKANANKTGPSTAGPAVVGGHRIANPNPLAGI